MKKLLIAILVLGALIVGAYFLMTRAEPGTPDRPYSISHVLANSDSLDGTVVTVRGVVEKRAGILGAGAYTLSDAGENILIVTKDGMPAMGETLTVTGTFHQAFELMSKDQVVILEKARKS